MPSKIMRRDVVVERADGVHVALDTRPSVAVRCPRCWTEQNAQRNTCSGCGASFVYRDEAPYKMAPLPYQAAQGE